MIKIQEIRLIVKFIKHPRYTSFLFAIPCTKFGYIRGGTLSAIYKQLILMSMTAMENAKGQIVPREIEKIITARSCPVSQVI